MAEVVWGACKKCGGDNKPFACRKNARDAAMYALPSQCMDCDRDDVRTANLARKAEREEEKRQHERMMKKGRNDRYWAKRRAKEKAEKAKIRKKESNDRWRRKNLSKDPDARNAPAHSSVEEKKQIAMARAEKLGVEIPEGTSLHAIHCRISRHRAKLAQGYGAVIQEREEADAAMREALSLEQRALREAARREICRRSLLHLIKRFEGDYQAGWVHRLTCRKLEQFLMDVIDKKSPRLMIFMPPRTGKSLIASQYFPLYALAKFPWLEIIATSYALALPLGFSKKIRALIRGDADFKNIFPKIKLDPDTTGAEHWLTSKGGGFRAAGVGGPITGTGGHILIIDDPVKNWEEAESESQREAVWNWYTSTLYTRQAPGAGILVIQCMTGDTPVLMADGTEQRLDSIRPGAFVASYDHGELVQQRVLNWASQGRDAVFRITMSSGRTVRANARHPFLVDDQGELKWVRLRNLRSTQRIVTRRADGGGGEGRLAAQEGARNPRGVGAFAQATTISGNGQQGTARHLHERTHPLASARSSNIGMAFRWASITKSWLGRVAHVLSVGQELLRRKTQNIGSLCFASTIATTPAGYEASCATVATCSSARTVPPHSLSPQLSTFATEEIVAIEYAGQEEVFDIQVENTENFVANGLVSHNTRWHDDDLSGRLLELEKLGAGDGFEVISFPAIAVQDEQFREKGEALHPERYDVEALRKIERTVGPRVWNALYQQNPTPDDGEYFKRGQFRFYDKAPPLHTLRIYAGWDLAITKKEENDPSCGFVVGVDSDDYWYVLERYLGRWEADDLIDQICTSLEVWRPTSTWIEREKITLALGPSLEREMDRRRLTSSHIQDIPPGRRDKIARARGAQALMNRHRILFPRDADWTPDTMAEMLRFPNGKHDDQVDALALVAQMGSLEAPPGAPRGEAAKAGWREKILRQGGVGEKSAMSS